MNRFARIASALALIAISGCGGEPGREILNAQIKALDEWGAGLEKNDDKQKSDGQKQLEQLRKQMDTTLTREQHRKLIAKHQSELRDALQRFVKSVSKSPGSGNITLLAAYVMLFGESLKPEEFKSVLDGTFNPNPK